MDRYFARVLDRVCREFVSRRQSSSGVRGRKGTGAPVAAPERLEPRTMLSASVQVTGQIPWVAQGPFQITGGQVLGMDKQQNPVAGAINAVLTKANDPNWALVGSVNGGIWRTTNATWSPNDDIDNDSDGTEDEADEQPTWTAVGQNLLSLSIADLAFDPMDTTQNTVWASAGNTSSAWQGGEGGLLYRSTDGGQTWQQQAQLNNDSDGKVAVRSLLLTGRNAAGTGAAASPATQVVLAGTQSPVASDRGKGALWRSENGGASWVKISGAAGTGLPAGPVGSMYQDPVNPNRLFAAISGSYPVNAQGVETGPSSANKGVWRSDDAGKTWSKVGTGLGGTSTSSRIVIAGRAYLIQGEGITNLLYAAVVGPNNSLSELYYTTNGGNSWVKIPGSVPSVSGGGQGGLHLAIVPSRTDPEILYVAGDRDLDTYGQLYRVDRTDGDFEAWDTSLPNSRPHADTRALRMDTQGNLILVGDGGIYRMRGVDNSLAVNRQWESMIGNLGISEIAYGVGYDPINRVVTAGLQDNGSVEQTAPNSGLWRATTGGDGNFQEVAIVGSGANERSLRWALSNNFGNKAADGTQTSSLRLRTFATQGPQAGQLLTEQRANLAAPSTPDQVLSGMPSESISGFIGRPMAVNIADPTRAMIAGDRLYETRDMGRTVTEVVIAGRVAGLSFSAVAYGFSSGTFGGPADPNIFYAAQGSTIHAGVRGANGVWTVASSTHIDISQRPLEIVDFAVDPVNKSIAWAVDRGERLLYTFDSGQTWHSFGRGLKTLRGAGPRSIAVVPDGAARTVMVGTDKGVYRLRISDFNGFHTDTGTPVEYRRMGTLPNVPVVDIDYVPPVFDGNGVRRNAPDGTPLGDVLVVGTLGRGAYTLENAKQWVNTETVLTITSDTASDTVELAVAADNPNVYAITVNGVVRSDLRLPVHSLDKVLFEGNGGDDTLKVNASVRSPGVPMGVTFNGGAAGQDSIQIVGGATGVVTRPQANAVNGEYMLDVGGLETRVVASGVEVYGAPPPPTPADQLRTTARGLAETAVHTASLGNSAQGVLVPGIGSVIGALDGQVDEPRKVSSPESGGATTGWFVPSAGTSLLARIFAEGASSFDLGLVGEGVGIDSFDAFRQKLDALDAIANNVTFTPTASGGRYDLRVVRRVFGDADAFVDALGGSVSLSGRMRIGADVAFHLVFGVDASGFFIDPTGPRDAAGNPEPELRISGIRSESPVKATGRLGLLEVTLDDGTIDASGLAITMDLVDLEGSADAMLRSNEITRELGGYSVVELSGAGSGNDVVLGGTFNVNAVLGGSAPFNLFNAKLDLNWADANDPSTLQLTVGAGAGADAAKLIDFAKRGVSDLITGLHAAAQVAQRLNKAGLLDQQIPVLGKSLGEVLKENPAPVVLKNGGTTGTIVSFGASYTQGTGRFFKVDFTGANLPTLGLNLEDSVVIRTVGGGTLAGKIAAVDNATLTLRVASDAVVEPDTATPEITVTRQGGLERQMNALLAQFNDISSATVRLPTLQELLRELGRLTGIPADQIPVTWDPATSSLVIAPTFALATLKYERPLDLSAAVPGLALSTSGKFAIDVTPTLRLPIGLTVAGNLPWEQRVFFAADATPEVALNVSASLDNPSLQGTVGFLNVTLGEDPAAVPNDGITLSGTFGINLISPANDGKLRVVDLSAPLTSIAATTVNATLDIDPLVVKADFVGATLGQLKLELNDYAITSASSLTALPGALAAGVTGNVASFTDFSNVTPAMVIAGLKALVQRLSDLGIGGDWANKPLPLINKSVSQILDMGEEFAKKLGDVDGVDTATILTAKGVEALLQSKGIPVTVKISAGEVRFDLVVSAVISQTYGLDLDLGGGKSIVSADLFGNLTLSGTASVNVGFGLLNQSSLDLQDRLFLASGPGHEVSLSASANVGYDLNNDGVADNQPLTATVSAFGKQFGVIKGRALLDLSLTGDIGAGTNPDGRLTFREIGQAVSSGNFADTFSTQFNGTAQALLPLDGNGDALVAYPTLPSGSPDALIQIGGSLASLIASGVEVRNVPGQVAGLPLPSNPATPLTPGQFVSNKFLVVTYNLDGFVAQGLLNFGTLFDGLEEFLDFGDDLLGINVLDFELPLLGKSPREVLDFFSATGAGSIGGLVQTLKTQGAAAAGQKLTNEAIYAAALLLRDTLKGMSDVQPIGDADLDGTVESNGDDLVSIDRTGPITDSVYAGATFASLAGGKFRVTLGSADFLLDGVQVGNDISYTGTGGIPSGGKVTKVSKTEIEVQPGVLTPFNPVAGTSVTAKVRKEIGGVTLYAKFVPVQGKKSLPFDLGLDALNLSGAFNVDFKYDLTVLLGMGISKQDGFYIVTDFSTLPMSGLTANSPEVSLTGRVEVTGKAGLTLGFLNLDADLGPAGQPAKTYLETQLGINFNGLGDNKLTLGELTNVGNLTKIVNIDSPNDRGLQLNIKAQVDVLLTTSVSSDLPSLSTNLVLKWFKPGAPDGTAFDPVALKGVPTPYLALENITLDVGSFVDSVISPVFKQIDKYNVLKPVIDIFDDELPILGKSLFELLIEPLPADQKETAMFLFQIASSITEAGKQAANNAGVKFNFGTQVILEAALPGAPVSAPPGGGGSDTGGVFPGDNLPGIGGYITDLGNLGITFPVLDTTNLVNFLIGQDVDLVFVNLKKLTIEEQFNVTIPLFSYGIPYVADVFVEAFFGGGFAFNIDFDAGFDTRGLRAGKDFIDGFYIGDFDPGANGIIDGGDQDKFEVSLDVQIFAGINAGVRLFGFPIGKVTGQGTIGAEIGIDLNDDNQSDAGVPFDSRPLSDRTDGKFHLDEIGTVLSVYGGSPLCLFDLGGRLYARLDITASVDLLFDKIEKTWGQEWTLLDFSAECEPVPPDLGNLVTSGGKTVLELTSTTDSESDVVSASNGSDNVQVVLADKNGIAEDGVAVLNLSAAAVAVTPQATAGRFTVLSNNAIAQWRGRGVVEGQRVRYTATSGQIVFGTATEVQDGQFTLQADTIPGGGGAFYTPKAGTTFAVLSGKETLRIIKEHSQEDFGPGETGANFIADVTKISKIRLAVGGPLDSFGGGDDIVFIDTLIAADFDLDGGTGSDRLTGGSGGGRLIGSDGNDMLVVALAPSDLTPAERTARALFLDGGAGDDTLLGGAGNDKLIGGTGDDILDGGGTRDRATAAPLTDSGNDTLIGGAGDDVLQGRDGDDLLVGDYATGFDPRPISNRLEGKDFIDAGAGDDAVWGDNYDGSNQSDGPEASASLQADDTIQGGDGNDLVYAGSGADQVHVGFGSDFARGGSGNDALYGEEGSDTLLGDHGNDLLEGGQGNNLLFGGWHNDLIRAGDGNDYMEGGPGDDHLCAEDGNDTIYGGTTALGLPFLGKTPDVQFIPGGYSAISCDSIPVYFYFPASELTDESNISGVVINDLDGDGVRDLGEKGLNSWTVELLDPDGVVLGTAVTTTVDLNADGVVDPVLETGVYSFTEVPAGSYRVRLVTPVGWTTSSPVSKFHDIEVGTGEEYTGVDFAAVKFAGIQGTKFVDSNGNGLRDPGENGLPGVTVYLDLNNNGKLDSGEPTRITATDDPSTPVGEAGNYEFAGLAPGVYRVREVSPSGYLPTDSTEVYSNDFSTAVGSEWSVPASIVGTKGNGLLGDLSAGTATLTVKNLPAHNYVTIEFDLAILGSWDGNIGPDAFLAAIRGQAPFLYATFANAISGAQSWPIAGAAPFSGAFSVSSLGFGVNADSSPADALYRVCFTLPHDQATLVLDLTAQGITGFAKGDDLVVESYRLLGDFNGDRTVNRADADVFLASLNRFSPDPRYDARADFDADGDVDGVDYARFRANLGKVIAPPVSPFAPLSGSTGELRAQLTVDNVSVRSSVTVVFTADVAATIDVADLRVTNILTGAVIDPALMSLSYDPLARRAVWTFPGLTNGTLSDANYRFTLLSAGLSVPAAGNGVGAVHLDGNSEESYEAWGIDNLSISVHGLSNVVTVASGTQVTGVDLANQLFGGTISGSVFNDADSNGSRGAGEALLPGIGLYADLNKNGNFDPGEPTATTGTSPLGGYTFTGLPAGNYPIRIQPGQGLTVTTPLGGAQTVEVIAGRCLGGFTFGVTGRVTSNVSGVVFFDTNFDGIRQINEGGYGGVRIYADYNDNGLFDAGEPSAISAVGSGAWVFSIVAGPAKLRAIADRLTVTTPADEFALVTTTGPGGSVSGIVFGVGQPGPSSITEPPVFSGFVFADLNSNGLWDTFGGTLEPRLDDWSITAVTFFNSSAGNGSIVNYLLNTSTFDVNGDGTVVIPGETGAAALYAQQLPQPNQYSGVRFDVLLKDGWLNTTNQTVQLLRPTSGTATFAFGVRPRDLTTVRGSITGTVWTDINGNATRDAGEVGFAGSTLYLDINNNSALDIGEPTAVTSLDNPFSEDVDEGGHYFFNDLPVGNYRVRQLVPTGFLQTFPASNGSYFVSLGGGTVTGRDFALREVVVLPDGSDTLNGDGGNDSLIGDNGFDLPNWVTATGAADIVDAGEGDDVLLGQQGNDTLSGDEGLDLVAGMEGDDLLLGGDGNDTVVGGIGNDVLVGGAGSDSLLGGTGDDTFVFGDSSSLTTDKLLEEINSGSDTLDLTAVTSAVNFDLNEPTAITRATNLAIHLTDLGDGDGSGNFENILGSLTASNVLIGNDADNLLVGGNLGDTLDGSNNNDRLVGNAGNDSLTGSFGADTLSGGTGADTLAGGNESDVYLFNDDYGADTLLEPTLGGGADDVLDFSGVTFGVNFQIGNLIAVIPEDDVLFTTDRRFERLIGSAGDNNFAILATTIPVTPIRIDGGPGSDALDYSGYTGGAVSVNLAAGTATGTNGISNIENVFGTPDAPNTLIGNAGPNFLVGGFQNDTLLGGDGADTLFGLSGNDSLTGGAGNDSLFGATGDDTFVFAPGSGSDTLSDTDGTNDIVDFSAFASNLFLFADGSVVALTGESVTFTGIELVRGGTGSNIVFATNAGSAFVVSGPNAGTVGALGFTGFGVLRGGTGVDTFTFLVTGSLTGSIDGQGNSDTLVGPNAPTSWQLTGVNAGKLGTLPFSNIENLTGGSDSDIFALLPGGSVTGTVDGGAGTDTLDYTFYASPFAVNLLAGTATGTGGILRIEGFIPIPFRSGPGGTIPVRPRTPEVATPTPIDGTGTRRDTRPPLATPVQPQALPTLTPSSTELGAAAPTPAAPAARPFSRSSVVSPQPLTTGVALFARVNNTSAISGLFAEAAR